MSNLSNTRSSLMVLAGAAALTALLTGCQNAASGSKSASAPKSVEGTAAPAPGDPTKASGTGSSTGTSAGDTTTTTGTQHPAAPATSATPATPAAPAAPAGSSRCTVTELQATVGASNPGAGQVYVPILLTNTSDRACTLYGYPGLEFDDASHQPVVPDPDRNGSTGKVFSLAPGASAYAPLHFPNPGDTTTATVTPTWIAITPPDETRSLTVRWTGGAVPGNRNAPSMDIGVFSPGRGA